ncbi:MAG: FadR/GntR family transcriptional regulator, partial [Burkholderiales bacterium]
MRIRPVAAERKLSRRLFEQLAAQIRSGRFAPGARLPTEQALTRAARVSRTVVREAVAALRAEGLVVTRQGVGAFVSAEPQRAPFRIEPERMQSLDDILAVMELRLGVEIESAGLAAERASRAQVRAIGAALEAIEQAADA